MTRELTLAMIQARTVEEGNCLIWTAYSSDGVPKIDLNGKTLSVRREIYKLVHGEIPDRLQVGVKCKTPCCVHPDCLVARSRSRAMKEANYTVAGNIARTLAKRARSNITMDIAREIRSSTEPATMLEQRLGLFAGCVRRIRGNRSWQDHTNPFAGLGA
jgi:hypothetical protein